jgi:hypothetical protein
MTNQFKTSGQVQWLTEQAGGRAQPPAGPLYAATARFADEPVDHQFSVVLHLSGLPTTNGPSSEADLGLLNSDLWPEIQSRLAPGCQLLIHEGRRVVAVYAVARVFASAPG